MSLKFRFNYIYFIKLFNTQDSQNMPWTIHIEEKQIVDPQEQGWATRGPPYFQILHFDY